jgi:two-component system response regulator YesN
VEQYNNESARRYRMILVDDEDEVRGRISSRISAESGFDVVGTAGNGYDALDLVEEYDPHVVLTDIKMPYIDGIELAAIQNSLRSIMLSSPLEADAKTNRLRELGLDLDGKAFFLAVMTVEHSQSNWDIIEYERTRQSATELAQRNLDREGIDYQMLDLDRGLAMLLIEDGPVFRERIDQNLYEIMRGTEHFLSLKVSIAISSRHSGFRQLHIAYREALEAGQKGIISGSTGLNYFREEMPEPGDSQLLLDGEREAFSHALRYGPEQAEKRILENISARIPEGKQGLVVMRLVMLELYGLLIEYARLLEVPIWMIAEGDSLDTLGSFLSFSEFSAWLVKTVGSFRAEAKRAKMDNAQLILSRVIDYLDANYHDRSLNMQAVCESQGISVSYLGQLFKRHRNSSFVRELTAIRIEKAKEQLVLSGDRIVEIAEACGYRDVYYFSHCFKKYEGCSPREYRASHQ